MPLALDRAEIEHFRSLVVRRLGLSFDDGKLDYLSDVLRGRIEAGGHAHGAGYLNRLAGPPDWGAETYFFRYWEHFRAFVEIVLPACSGPRELRILSAGCASGEEAYTLAILVQEHLPAPGGPSSVRIHGIDINPSMIERATRARYSAWSLRETPPDLRERHFRPEGREFVLDASVRSRVSFEERNLVDPDPLFWREGAFDVVFCRNVTMYFPLEVSRAVIGRISGSLVPGGYLFLGHAETLRGVSEAFHLRQSHGTFYYQRRGAHEPAPLSPPSAGRRAPAQPVAPVASLLDAGESWVDVIRRASERIAALADAPGRSERAGEPGKEERGSSRRPWDLSAAFDLVRKERFTDALTLLGALPAESEGDPDAQLLRAIILTNGGDLGGAQSVCRRILETDELHSGAHYLMALCLEHEGQRDGALEHDRAAAYLDATFAMPRFHLGLLAKREGDFERARREFEQALALLAREDASRILLFGGGFSREALVELCRAELRACGGGP